MPNKYMKRYSTSAIIRKMQIHNTTRYHLTPLRMAIVKKKKNQKNITSAGEDVEKLEALYSVGENAKCAASVETVWNLLRKL